MGKYDDLIEQLKRDHKPLCYAVMRGVGAVGLNPDDGLTLLAETIDKLRHQRSCVVCSAYLMPSTEPPHCEDCTLLEEHYEEYEVPGGN